MNIISKGMLKVIKKNLIQDTCSHQESGPGEVGTWDHPQGTVYIAVASWACL